MKRRRGGTIRRGVEDAVGLGRRRPDDLAEAAGFERPELRVLRRRRGALNGRALVGGLLVALAGVGLFAGYSGAHADKRLPFVVAAHDLQPGERLSAADLTTARMQLPPGLAETGAFQTAAALQGAVMVAPLRAGELLQASDVIAAAEAPSNAEVSFPLDSARAVAGTLQPGETVTVLATYGTGQQAVTVVVVSKAQVVAVARAAGVFGSETREEITLGLGSGADALALTNAVDAAQVELVRTASGIVSASPYRAGGAAGAPTP